MLGYLCTQAKRAITDWKESKVKVKENGRAKHCPLEPFMKLYQVAIYRWHSTLKVIKKLHY
jgi:hypothetical protein